MNTKLHVTIFLVSSKARSQRLFEYFQIQEFVPGDPNWKKRKW
jgi:hypothetical protein